MQYHRLFGLLAWAAVTVHMVLWYVKWLKEGNFGNNIVMLANLKITPTNVGP